MEHRPLPIDRHEPTALDYRQLLAMLAVAQATSRTAHVAGTMPHPAPDWTRAEALVAIARAEARWAQAAQALGSSFHPGVAARAAEIPAKGS
jgi:hypothetical protein